MRAETAIQVAQAAEADEYAPAYFKAAAAALADAKSRTQRHDYDGARKAAEDAFQKAEQARRTAETGKAAMREKLENTLEELRREWGTLEKRIGQNKQVDGRLDELRNSVVKNLDHINTRTEAGELGGAEALTTTVRENLENIKATLDK